MAIQTVINFKNCATAVEEVRDSKGNLEARAFLIIDNDSDTVYRLIMNLDIARSQGQHLMGGNVAIADESAMADEIARRQETQKP